MKGICVGLLAFLLCACASTEIQEIVEVKTPETALVNELGHVEDNLMMSEALGGFTLYDDVKERRKILLTQADIEQTLKSRFNLEHFTEPVSYTHLTLPTT